MPPTILPSRNWLPRRWRLTLTEAIQWSALRPSLRPSVFLLLSQPLRQTRSTATSTRYSLLRCATGLVKLRLSTVRWRRFVTWGSVLVEAR